MEVYVITAVDSINYQGYVPKCAGIFKTEEAAREYAEKELNMLIDNWRDNSESMYVEKKNDYFTFNANRSNEGEAKVKSFVTTYRIEKIKADI